jgi:hypothetical protein
MRLADNFPGRHWSQTSHVNKRDRATILDVLQDGMQN